MSLQFDQPLLPIKNSGYVNVPRQCFFVTFIQSFIILFDLRNCDQNCLLAAQASSQPFIGSKIITVQALSQVK